MFDKNRFKTVLKAWPVVAIATISLCYATQLVAGWFGLDLPEQKNVDVVRAMFRHAFENWKYFGCAALNVALVLAILPALEEVIFRFLLFRLPTRGFKTQSAFVLYSSLVVSSLLFSAAHYIAQPFPDNAFVALFFFGLAQCWLYRKTERLWCPILNHALFNFTNLVLLFIIPA